MIFLLFLSTGCESPKTISLMGPTLLGTPETSVELPSEATCEGGYARIVIIGDEASSFGASTAAGTLVEGDVVADWLYAAGEVLPLFSAGKTLSGGSARHYLVTRNYYVDHWDRTNGLPESPGVETLVLRSHSEVPVERVYWECLPSKMYGRQ